MTSIAVLLCEQEIEGVVERHIAVFENMRTAIKQRDKEIALCGKMLSVAKREHSSLPAGTRVDLTSEEGVKVFWELRLLPLNRD